MRKILVTGVHGAIGSHFVVELQNNIFKVVVIDDLSNINSNKNHLLISSNSLEMSFIINFFYLTISFCKVKIIE